VTLTVGKGPFGHRPGGVFNFELPRREGLLYFEESPRRIRGVFAGETIVDSRHAKLLHEHGRLPLYYFPESEVRMDLLQATDHTTRCPWKGDASYWTIAVGDRTAENAAWSYPDPIEGAPPIAGHLAFYWDSLDEWFEEDEPAIVHARDPYHRIDVLDTSRHVRIEVGGETVAETTRARVLYETSLPPRWYIPPEDVEMDKLKASDTRTGCAYKGFASYYSVEAGRELEDDLVWHYEEPRPEAVRIAGYLAFFNERVDVYLDGELQEQPVTQWSRRQEAPSTPTTTR
jgi:uncharacterized protein (DUF427 family)